MEFTCPSYIWGAVGLSEGRSLTTAGDIIAMLSFFIVAKAFTARYTQNSPIITFQSVHDLANDVKYRENHVNGLEMITYRLAMFIKCPDH
jgi:hypothetical protein